MSAAIIGMLAGVAGRIGAPFVKGILKKHLGDNLAGTLAGKFVDEIAAKAGVEPEELETVPDEELSQAIKETEANAPEIITLWQRGLEYQSEALQADAKLGFWNMFWRSGWMYLLAFFWVWRIVVTPLADAYGRPLEAVDYGHLLTLTGWFMALYMGGHTLKEIGKNVADSVSKRKGDRP